jgi:hypothetical protein
LSNRLSKLLNENFVQLSRAQCSTLRLPSSPFRILQTFCLSLLNSFGFREDALPLIPVPATTPLQNHRSKFRMFSRSTRHGSITARQKLQMIQVRATQAECASLLIKCDHSSREQIVPTFATFGISANEEHQYLAGLLLDRGRLHLCILADVRFTDKRSTPRHQYHPVIFGKGG